MSRAISLFGSLPKLSALLRDVRATAIFDQFLKHHRTGEGIAEAVQYRRALTLDDMREAVYSGSPGEASGQLVLIKTV